MMNDLIFKTQCRQSCQCYAIPPPYDIETQFFVQIWHQWVVFSYKPYHSSCVQFFLVKWIVMFIYEEVMTNNAVRVKMDAKRKPPFWFWSRKPVDSLTILVNILRYWVEVVYMSQSPQQSCFRRHNTFCNNLNLSECIVLTKVNLQNSFVIFMLSG